MYRSDDIIDLVWNKGIVVDGFEPRLWRKDELGAWIARLRYSDNSSDYGWEAGKIAPGGPDTPANLRPLQWRNCPGGGGHPSHRVTAEGDHNVVIRSREGALA